jgi:RNA polymerase sigma-70 factor (ECF subfamily)
MLGKKKGRNWQGGSSYAMKSVLGMVAERSGQELIDACRAGNRDAFRELFERYKDRVYGIALRYSGDRWSAMDITQDVFVKLFAGLGGFRGDSSFDSWLYRLVVNGCLDHRRKTRRLLPLLEETISRLLPQRESLTDELVRAELNDRVQAAVAKLPAAMRMAVVLRYTEGLAYEEIASALGCSKGTVASRLGRAHRELARRLLPGRREE